MSADAVSPSALLRRRIAEHAARTPCAPAIRCAGRTTTYAQLDAAAAAITSAVVEVATVGQVIGLVATRSARTIAAVLGILGAGGAWLPLDPDDPPTRRGDIIARGGVELVVADADVEVPYGVRVLRLDATNGGPPPNTGLTPDPDPLAYVMPTSGSTGIPKLVEISAAGLLEYTDVLAEALGGVRSTDRWLHSASFEFSSSVRQMFLPLLHGACVVLAVGAERLDPRDILALCRLERVTIVDLLPSVLDTLDDHMRHTGGNERDPFGPELRLLLSASEPLPAALATSWLDRLGRSCEFRNMYGQTETTGIVCTYVVSAGTAADDGPRTVPIGSPLASTTIRIVAKDGSIAADGAAGELWLAGAQIMRGYRGQPTASREQLVSTDGRMYFRTGDLVRRDPSSGQLYHLGRLDSQVKVRGHRVDLGEIEAALIAEPGVRAAVTIGTSVHDGRIDAYVECANGYADRDLLERVRRLPNGLRILDLNRADTDFMFAEIFERQVYFRGGVTLPDDAFVIDAGANVGLFTLAIAAALPRSRIIAFEPAAPTARVLQVNLALNECGNVQVRQQALAGWAGAAELTFYRHAVGMSSIHADHAQERETLVSVISNQLAQGAIITGEEIRDMVSDLAEAKLAAQLLSCEVVQLSDVITAESIDRIDLLKIDVQKAEIELIDGIDDRHWSMIDQIVIEVHDLDGRKDTLVRHLAERGYEVTTHQDVMFVGSAVYYVYARSPRTRSGRTAGEFPAPPARADLRALDGAALRRQVASRLPAWAVPTRIQITTPLPRTASGKLDRAAVADHARVFREAAPGRPVDSDSDPLLAHVREIWAEVLGKDVDGSSDFFDVGGNSLSAARVVTRIRERLSPEVSIRNLFEHPELADFVAAIRTDSPSTDPAR